MTHLRGVCDPTMQPACRRSVKKVQHIAAIAAVPSVTGPRWRGGLSERKRGPDIRAAAVLRVIRHDPGKSSPQYNMAFKMLERVDND